MISTAVLPQRATVERASKAGDGAGGWIETFSTLATDVPCRCGGAGTYGSIIADQQDGRPARPVWFLPGADVRIGDRVTVAGVGAMLVRWVEEQADGAYRKAFTVPDPAAVPAPAT